MGPSGGRLDPVPERAVIPGTTIKVTKAKALPLKKPKKPKVKSSSAIQEKPPLPREPIQIPTKSGTAAARLTNEAAAETLASDEAGSRWRRCGSRLDAVGPEGACRAAANKRAGIGPVWHVAHAGGPSELYHPEPHGRRGRQPVHGLARTRHRRRPRTDQRPHFPPMPQGDIIERCPYL